MFTLGLIIGLFVGAVFHAVLTKWFFRAKNTASELAKDIKTEAEKASKKMSA